MRTILNLFTTTIALFTGLSLFSQGNYCQPYSECQLTYNRDVFGPSQLSIVDIEFDTQFNNTQAYNPRACVNNGYQDFSADKKGIVEQNGEYDLIVYAEPYSHQYSSTGYICQVWCDWDMDFEFEDSELTIIPSDQVGAFSTFNIFFQGKIVVPANANIGETRMRIRVHHSTDAPEPLLGTSFLEAVPDTMPGPCDSTRTGDTEDYGLLVYSTAPTPTEYCSASGPKDCRGSRLDLDGGSLPTKYEWHYIDTVRIDGEFGSGITNTSDLAECKNFKSYGDYTKKYKYPPSWIPGNQYEVYVTRADDNSDELPVSCGIWIDWNNDFDFEDPDETYMDFRTFQVDSQTRYHPFTILVPPTATLGRKRMRIRTTVAQSTPRACGDKFNNGEVEDYEIFVSDTGGPATFLACTPEASASPRNVINICQANPLFRWGAPTTGDAPTGYYFYLGTNTQGDNVIDKMDIGPNLSYAFPGSLNANTREVNEVCTIFNFRTGAGGDPMPDIDGPDVVLDTVILCPTIGTTLDANVSGGNGTLTYQWFGNGAYAVGGGGNSATLDYLANVQASGDYIVRVTDEHGCTGEDDVHVITKQPASTGTLNGLTNVCKYSDLTVSLSGSVGKLQWQEYDSFKKVWNNLDGENSSSITFTNIRWPRQYRVYASLAGCGDTLAPFTVNSYPIPPKPNVTSSIGENLCGGDTAVLTSSSNFLNVWNTEDSTQSIEATKHGLYTVYYVNNNGCHSDTASFQIIDYPDPPKPTISSEKGFGFCIGDSIELVGDANGVDFYWNGNARDRNRPFPVSKEGKYYITAINGGGCLNTSDTIVPTIHPLPNKANITSPTGKFEFCEGASVDLVLNTTDDVNWMNDPANSQPIFKVNFTGEVFAKLISNQGCVNYSDTVVINSNPLPKKPEISNLVEKLNYCYYDSASLYIADNKLSLYWDGDKNNDTDTLVVKVAGEHYATVINEFACQNTSEKYAVHILDTMFIPEIKLSADSMYVEVPSNYKLHWYIDGLPIPFATNSAHVSDVGGLFKVRLIDENNCLSFTEPFKFTFGMTTGIHDFEEVSIMIAPNPVNAGDILRILGKEKISNLRLIEQTGKEILVKENSNELRLPSISTGIYYLQVSFENGNLAPVTRAIVVNQ